MTEVKNVGEAIGVRFSVPIEKRIDGAAPSPRDADDSAVGAGDARAAESGASDSSDGRAGASAPGGVALLLGIPLGGLVTLW